MAPAGASSPQLARLEAALDAIAAERDAAVLAFSGGLASLVLAALLRKRLDLDCVVVGLDGAPDLLAARRAADFLDYRVVELRLSPKRAVALVRRVLDRRRVAVRAAVALAPVMAVVAANPGKTVIAGCGARPDSLAPLLVEAGVALPWWSLTAGRGMPRSRIQALARELGLPEPFVRVRARSPPAGTGLEAALRSVGRERGLPLRGLFPRRGAYD